MKTQNKILLITLLPVFLSACNSTAIESNRSVLLEPEGFIADRKEVIAQTVALGPRIIIDAEQALEKKKLKLESQLSRLKLIKRVRSFI